MHIAASKGLSAMVQRLLAAHAQHSIPEAQTRYTPLHRAAQAGHADVVGLLVAAGADVNALAHHGLTALYEAASAGHTNVVQVLLTAHADVDARAGPAEPTGNRTALHEAACKGHAGIVHLLLQARADVNAVNNQGITALYKAAQEGHLEVVQCLLAHPWRADVSLAAAQYNQTPLHVAAYAGHTAIVQALIAAGGNVNLASQRDVTAMHMAATEGHYEVAEALLSAGADANCKDAVQGCTPLHKAVWAEDDAMVQLLLKHPGVDVNAAAYGNVTPLRLAVVRAQPAAVQMLLDAGAQVEVEEDSGDTVLHVAVQAVLKAQINVRSPVGARLAAQYCRAPTSSSGDPEMHDSTGTATPASDVPDAPDDVSASDDRMSDIQSTDDDCESYVSDDDTASTDGGLEQVAAAQGAAATAGATAATKHTALWPRIEEVYAHVVQQLVNHPLAKAGVNTANKLRQHPLHIAAEQGHAAIAGVLLSAGASVHATDGLDQQPLHKAAQGGHITVVQLLIKHGAVVYAKDRTGAVPLFLAAREGHASVVQALVSAGATCEVRDCAGQQPLLAAVAAASFPAVRSMRSVHAIVLAADSRLAAEYAKAWLWNNSKQQEEVLQQMLQQQLGSQSVPAMPDLSSEQVQLVTGLQPRGESDYLNTIQLLLQAGAHVSGGVGERQSTALHQAAAGGAEQVAQMLLNAGAQIDAKDETGRVPLSNAAAEGKEGVVHVLLGWPGQDADAVDSRDDEGNTPLIWAAGGGHVEVMQQLLNAGASLTAANEDGLTPLMRAAMAGSADSLQLLIKAGASLEETDKEMHTALSWAAEEGHTGAVQALLAAGAHVDANVPISEDFVSARATPLLLAVEHGHTRVVKALVAAHANVNAYTAASGTPALANAAQEGEEALVQALLLSNDIAAQTMLKAACGAADAGHASLAVLIVKALAERDVPAAKQALQDLAAYPTVLSELVGLLANLLQTVTRTKQQRVTAHRNGIR